MGMEAINGDETLQDAGGLPDHLRRDEQHEIHHHLGDVGGEYETRPIEDLDVQDAAKLIPPEVDLELDREGRPVFIVVMVRGSPLSICIRINNGLF